MSLFRKCQELKSKRYAQLQAAEKALEAGDQAAYDKAFEEAKSYVPEIERLEALISEKSRFGTSGSPAPENIPAPGINESTKNLSGMDVMLKHLRGENLDQNESGMIRKALITGDNAVSGENYLIPEDVDNQIRELRRSYISAKPYVTVTTTDTLSGSVVYEEGLSAELHDFDDGDDVPGGDNPTFKKKPFTIKFKGRLIPISRVLLKVAASFMSYIKKYFVRGAVLTENKSIFNCLAAGHENTPTPISGLDALKEFINTVLDPEFVKDGVILTNQSGFNAMDQEKDNFGHSILQPDPSDPTKKVFQGLPIVVFSDKQLAPIDATHFPMFVGDTQAGCEFKEYEGLLFAVSDHYFFGKNQTCLRLIEGYDVVSGDTDAYGYISYSKPAEV